MRTGASATASARLLLACRRRKGTDLISSIPNGMLHCVHALPSSSTNRILTFLTCSVLLSVSRVSTFVLRYICVCEIETERVYTRAHTHTRTCIATVCRRCLVSFLDSQNVNLKGCMFVVRNLVWNFEKRPNRFILTSACSLVWNFDRNLAQSRVEFRPKGRIVSFLTANALRRTN